MKSEWSKRRRDEVVYRGAPHLKSPLSSYITSTWLPFIAHNTFPWSVFSFVFSLFRRLRLNKISKNTKIKEKKHKKNDRLTRGFYSRLALVGMCCDFVFIDHSICFQISNSCLSFHSIVHITFVRFITPRSSEYINYFCYFAICFCAIVDCSR